MATEPDATRETDAGIEIIPEYETDLLVATVPELVRVHPRPVGTLRRWAPILVKFASVQVAVQVIGFAAGILVVRNLPKREYALYILCNTMLATILTLADSGISSALTSIGGQIWHDKERLSQLIRTALQLRRWMVMVALPVVVPVLVYLLLQNGATVTKTILLVVAVLVGCGLELITRIYVVALRLKSEIRQIQNQALVAAVVKLAIVGIAVLLWFNVGIAIFAVVAGYAVQYWMLHQWHGENLNAKAPGDPEMRTEILAVVRKTAPHSIYYCLQSQIIVWLISIFGNAERVADVGALGRLALLFSILGTLGAEVVFPAFARIQSAQLLRKRYYQIISGHIAVSALLVSAIALFPRQVIWILGKQYLGLQGEAVFLACSAVLGSLYGVAWGLAYTRSWILSPLKFISASIVVQAVLVFALNLSTVRGILLFSILSTIPNIIWIIWFGDSKMRGLMKPAIRGIE